MMKLGFLLIQIGFLTALIGPVALAEDEAPGACRAENELFSTEEGGCLHFASGTVWSAKAPSRMAFSAAHSYCAGLNEAGQGDWSLPTRGELEKLTGPEGAAKHLDMGVVDFFWSSTSSNQAAIVVNLASGEKSNVDKSGFSAAVLCRRRPPDADGDGVPDSSDVCNHTPRGLAVATSGPRKGCGPDESPFPAHVGCKVDSDYFVTANGGCVDRNTSLTWSSRSKEAQPMKFAERYCSVLREGYGEHPLGGWRLPSADELRAVAGRELAGTHFKFPVNEEFWSVSRRHSGDNNGDWIVADNWFALRVNLSNGNLSSVLYASRSYYWRNAYQTPAYSRSNENTMAFVVCVR